MTTKAAMQSHTRLGVRVSVISIVMNVILAAFKLVAGIVGHSAAMLSDAVHSLSDVVSTFIVLIGIRLSGKPADGKHRFGHDRFESIASIILACMLFVVGLGIGYNGVVKVIEGSSETLAAPGTIALVAAVVSIVAKEIMYWYTRWAAKKTNSEALLADAWHHRSDALSSIGSFVGILGAMLGFPLLDPLASIVICVFILKVAIDVFRSTTKKLVDESCDEELVDEILKSAHTVEGVQGVEDIRTRKFGNGAYVEILVVLDDTLSLVAANDITKLVHDKIEHEHDIIKHCVVCPIPSSAADTLTRQSRSSQMRA